MRRIFVVVDDNQLEGDGATAQLKRFDPTSEVLRAASSEAAVSLLEERRVVPSLIFLDYQMPGMNGIDTLVAFRGMRWLEREPVGACAFLTKPVPNFELREVVRNHCREARQMAAATMVPTTVAWSGTRAA